MQMQGINFFYYFCSCKQSITQFKIQFFMATHFTTRVYGRVFGNAPFFKGGIGGPNAAGFSDQQDWPYAPLMCLPTNNTIFHTLANGVLVGNPQFYCYSIVEVLPAGQALMEVNRTIKYATDSSVATLATLAG
jgi:hypothetical protein